MFVELGGLIPDLICPDVEDDEVGVRNSSAAIGARPTIVARARFENGAGAGFGRQLNPQ